MSKGNGGMIAMLAGGMAGMFVASAVGGVVITKINGNETEEKINITGIKDAYVVCSQNDGVEELHKAKIEYLKSDPQQGPVDFNKLTFKCDESIINKRVKISESKPEDEEYNLVCTDCFAD